MVAQVEAAFAVSVTKFSNASYVMRINFLAFDSGILARLLSSVQTQQQVLEFLSDERSKKKRLTTVISLCFIKHT